MPLYKKDWKYMPGIQARRAFSQICGESKKISDDTKNRDYVVKKIVQYIKEEGLSEEAALDKIMKDSIVKEFAYFEKYDINIREKFREWARKEIEHPRRENERTR